jgi:DNA polymerase-3 subunit epsilon
LNKVFIVNLYIFEKELKKQNMTFTAIDFETADASFPCEIGLSRVENGEITETKSWLIKPACFPRMNPWNQRIHGISSKDVSKSLTFDELRSTLAYYDLAIPRVEYFCTVNVSRKIWKQLPSHSLSAVSEFHNIHFNHHRAGDDAKVCALIALKAFENVNALNVEDGLKKMGILLKRL